MKKMYVFIPLLCFIQFAKAQIPDPSFETWNNGNPVGWSTSNATGDTGVTETFTAHDGSAAAELHVIEIANKATAPVLTSGSTATNQVYFPVSSAPAALHGWYIGRPVGPGDSLLIRTGVTENGDSSGGGLQLIGDTTAVYKEFVVNYNYFNTMSADSATITFTLFNASIPLDSNTYFIIDDLSFGPDSTSGIAQPDRYQVLEACSPNPAGNVANIIYSITNQSTVNLMLYDIVGHQVRTLLENRQQTPGRYKVPTDVSNLPNGVYLYRLNVNGQAYTQKLVVSK